jgi:anti-sigma regulatory factor (Ser/Thr protein kinase)
MAGGDEVGHEIARQARRPWEHSGLRAAEMHSHSGDNGVSLKTPWMARMMVRHLLTEWWADAGVIDVAELLTSELVTNAVCLAPVGPERRGQVPYITLAVWYAPDVAVIEVSDENEKPPEVQVPDEESENGRGLLLVEDLSREWSYYYPRKGWKTVYCVVSERCLPGNPENRHRREGAGA